MAARLEQDAKRRAKEKPNLVVELNLFELLCTYGPSSWWWDKAVESLGRSARVMEELAESTGEAIARISARGDRIDRIQKETRALLNALVASEADA